MTGVFHFMAVSLYLNLLVYAISLSETCQLRVLRTATAASLRAVVSHQLVGESPISQAVGVQFELIAPPQYVSAFDDRQFAHKPSRIAEGRGDRRGLDQLRQVHSGLPAILEPKIYGEVGICLGMGDATH